MNVPGIVVTTTTAHLRALATLGAELSLAGTKCSSTGCKTLQASAKPLVENRFSWSAAGYCAA